MKILVTGSAGFIGRHICPELAHGDHEVVGVDHHTGHDLTVPGVFQDTLSAEQPDIVLHLAAQPGRLFGDLDVVQTIHSNAVMTAIVAVACGQTRTRLAYVSTSEIYGDVDGTSCEEYSGPFALPANLYGLTKRWGEDVCALYAPSGLIVMRPNMTYGPDMEVGWGRAAMPTMIWRALNSQRIEVHRGTERSWCHIDDIARAMRLIIERGEGTYNVGRDDDARSMEAIAGLACNVAGASRDLIDIFEPPPGLVPVKRLSMQRLRDLGFSPDVSLEDGMRDVYQGLVARTAVA